MTLLVGIVCQDGAVIAADKQTSHGSMGGMTVGMPTTKIKAIKDKVLLASSGWRGTGIQLGAMIEDNIDGFERQPVAISIKQVQDKHRQLAMPLLQAAQSAVNVIGHQAAQSEAICGSLLAAKWNDGVYIVEITPLGAAEFYSRELPFICLGSGKPNSDPFLAYLWSVFFRDSLPTLQEGALLAYWAIKQAISSASPHIGLGIDVFTLDPNAKPITKELSDADLAPHIEFIDEAANALRGLRDRMGGKAEKVPDIPTLKKEGTKDGA
jgi:20S proteasome alpha/beta subunit